MQPTWLLSREMTQRRLPRRRISPASRVTSMGMRTQNPGAVIVLVIDVVVVVKKIIQDNRSLHIRTYTYKILYRRIRESSSHSIAQYRILKTLWPETVGTWSAAWLELATRSRESLPPFRVPRLDALGQAAACGRLLCSHRLVMYITCLRGSTCPQTRRLTMALVRD